MASILGVDVGGTFTDFLLWEDGRLAVYKRPSTPNDLAQGVLLGLGEMAVQPQEVVHGSTIATNALLERRGARTGLITTRGFRDVLVIGRQTRPKLYDLSPQRPPPLVPDELRLEVGERLDHTGAVLVPLDPEEAEAAVERLAQEGVESVAICFLFSFLNPQHERLVAEAARRRGLFVSASCEVLPEYREYERTSTTVVNAYVSPVMSRYLARLEGELRAQGIGRLRVMQSNGGSMGPQAAGAMAARTVLSGPAGGVVGAFALGQQAGFDRIITFDMGGTSTDVSLCPGRIPEQTETDVGGLPVRTPVVDVHSIGAGGGSIARLDEGGALRVGPQSVGADPGPACYSAQGGLIPAVTDAQVVLGRIVPEHFLGGRMKLYAERSESALGGLASLAPAFGGDPVRAAESVVRVANANMERAIRVISVERGYDPRLFTLVAFGGAGPLHACDLAQALGIPRVLVTPFPGVLSAFGMVAAAPTRDFSQAAMASLLPQEGEEWYRAADLLLRLFDELRQRASAEMEAEGFARGSLSAQASLDIRYLGQSYELTVPVEEFAPAHVLPRFHAAHQERYGHSDPTRAVEVVNVRLKLTAAAEKPTLPKLPQAEGDADAAAIAERQVWFGDMLPTKVYDRERLLPGHRFAGPAIVVQMDATTAVPPGWGARVDDWGNLVLEQG